MLYDLAANAWSPTILQAADVAIEFLPGIAPAISTWPVEPVAARRFGLAPGAVAVLGGMDNGCSLLGATDSSETSLANIVGTYEHMAGAASLSVARSVASAAGGLVHAYPLPGRYISMTRVPMGDLLGEVAAVSPAGLEPLLDGVEPIPLGETLDLNVTAIRNVLAGGIPPARVLQQLFEAAAAVLARFTESWTAAVGEQVSIAAVGGGSARANLLQLRANVVGRPFSTLACDEAAGMGALRLAAMAVLGVSSTSASELFANPIVRSIPPNRGTRQRGRRRSLRGP
jgi:sugar (pentulose or hexulose) kinase